MNSRKNFVLTLGFTAALLASACNSKTTTVTDTRTGESTSTTVASASLTPEELGKLGAEIKRQPADAQRILSERGLTEETFEQAIRKVSEDPAASKRYAAAFNSAKS